MKTILGISAILATVLLAAGVLATSTPTITASLTLDPRTCGIHTSTPNLNFGEMLVPTTDTELTQQEIDVQNDGSVPTTSFTVQGTNWVGTVVSSSNTMPVGQTSVYDTAWYSLPSAPGTLFGGVVNSGQIVQTYFKLTVPAGQAADTYTQTITFTSGC